MKRIRFLHIPKSAGTTFVDILSRIYRGRLFSCYGTPIGLFKYQQLNPSERKKITLIIGHEPLITGVGEIDAVPTITLLRDPIERVKSFCQHISEGKSISLIDLYPPDKFDIDQFLNSGEIQLENRQAQCILGYIHYETYKNKNPSILVDRAIDLLTKRVICFGLMEYFDESLMLFRRQLDWPWPYYFSLNLKDKRRLVKFDDHHIEKICQMNQIDIQIYEYALEIFKQRMEENADYIEAYLPEFQNRQRLLSVFSGIYPYFYKVKRRYILRI